MKMHNFCSGPAILPKEVLEKAAEAVSDYKGKGLSLLEMSHRGSEVTEIIQTAQQTAISLCKLNANEYTVLFLHGGASLQFAMIPMNLLQKNETASYINTGLWTDKAIKEASYFGNVNIAGSSKDSNFSFIPKQYNIHPESKYVYIASNNTVYGTQYKKFPNAYGTALIADMSSDIFSREIDFSQFDMIYAGAQKNIGTAGVSMVIVKNELLEKCNKNIPSMLNFNVHAKNQSVFNTPPVFAIYVSMLTMQWIVKQGGLQQMEKWSNERAAILYNTIDENHLFQGTCAIEDRSNMNATFILKNEILKEKFENLCEENGIVNYKGHSTVGGYRASMYNALPLSSVQLLVDIMNAL